ncbi:MULTISPECIES: hypothetical protein [Pseudomonas]|uniref:Uncharacterized protein n=1 Tax=Pseudomonas spirodelae TaxID=3101751 RepID=A0ABU5PCQ0_9PSED|nr:MULTISPECIES: hypothetical protein [unclassified Pseudomonas]MBU0806856.1 hypothetical protein [Gammaproteobacteria bacterium]MBU0883599.1 hypothetical protein [Gammaproteobacteria bacterium]MDD2159465.1 hypothetical protein [Pseudomonas sp. MIL19]MEA1607290.1 hypothetical protein [Pseudomonas sp. T5W1]
MSSMEHQEVDLSKPQNPDLIWDLDNIARRELAERFIKLFENRLCVYSESTRQLYTNYDLHFPSDLGRKMVVLPNPYAFHDTLHGIEAQAIRKTGLCVLPGVVLKKPGLLLTTMIKEGGPAPKTMQFKPALAQIISNQKKAGDIFLPIMIKGDLREFNQQMPYIHLHRLQVSRLTRLSTFEREDIQQTITRKLLMLYRQADSLSC